MAIATLLRPVPINNEVLTASRLSPPYAQWLRDLRAQVNTTYQASALGLFNVVAFGAVADGVTDDGPAIAAAYAAVVANGGGAIYFPPGEYVTSQALKPLAFCSILGAGSRVSVITYTGTGYWLENTDIGIILNVTIQGFSWFSTTADGFANIGPHTDFSELNQHINWVFRDLYVTGKTGAIIAGSRGLWLWTFIRTVIDDCEFNDFDIGWECHRFDVGYVSHNRIQRFGTTGWYFKNSDGDPQPAVSDETVFIQNEILEIVPANTCAIDIDGFWNARFIATFLEPTGGAMAIGWRINNTYHCSIYGGTISTATTSFALTDCYDFTIEQVWSMDDADTPTATCTYTTPPSLPTVGVTVINCGYSIASALLGASHVTVLGFPFMQLPTMTTAVRDTLTPIAGLTIFNTSTSTQQTYDGATWQDCF